MKNKKLFIGLLSIGAMAFLFFFFHRNELGKELFHRGKALNKMIASLKRGVGGPSQQEGEKVSQKEDKVSAIMAQLPKEVKEGLRIVGSDDWDNNKQQEWENRLALLRLKANEVVPKIADTLRSIPIENHYPRYELTFLLGEIGSDQALPVLKEVIQEKVPEELMQYPQSEGTPGGSYLIVKTQAVDAIMMIGLQSDKKEEIKGTLVEGISSEYRPVRRASVMAMKQLFPDDPALKEKVIAMLPEKDKFFYDIKIQHEAIPITLPK